MSEAQLRAATSNEPLCYVKAGPGSGKTFLAAEAFGYLRFVRHQGASGGVTGVTFARSARKELENRVRVRWGARSIEWPNAICTFDELHRRLLRYLVYRQLIAWPGKSFPRRPQDSWAMEDRATPMPGKKRRCYLTLNNEGVLVVRMTDNKRLAPNPAFVESADFKAALKAGHCTHTDVRNVLSAAIDGNQHPLYAIAIRECLAGSISHLIVDEAFDMNHLDIAVVQSVIDAGVPVTIVGDPWQSLYEFRGSSPKSVQALLDGHDFDRIDMPGKHRYDTDEMLDLSARLFNGEPFQVEAARIGEDFNVVLAHDWGTLWAEKRVSVLPAGIPSKIDKGRMASCFILLVNEVARTQFGHEASGVGEAIRALEIEDPSPMLAIPMALLRNPESSEDDIWNSLREAFQPVGATKRWPDAKKMAKIYMSRLIEVLRAEESPALGLTVHQAKGLEWTNVLFLDSELSTAPGVANVLSIDESSHRSVYVGLTRARAHVRILRVEADRFGPDRSPITYERVPAS